MNRAQRITDQLGMPHGTANGKLRKQLLFKYVQLANCDVCHKCGEQIETVDNLSIEHILPWEGRDAELFWDLDNVTFSHLGCNKPHTYRKNNFPARRFVEGETGYCSCCKENLSYQLFWKDSSRPSGLQAYCVPCIKKKRKKN